MTASAGGSAGTGRGEPGIPERKDRAPGSRKAGPMAAGAGNGGRLLQWTLVASLLAVAAGFPLVQAVYEAAALGETPFFLDLFRRAPNKENLHRWDSDAKDRSIFAKWLRPRTLQLRYDIFKETAPKAVPGADGWLFYDQDVEYLLDPPYSDPRFYAGTFDTLIDGRRVNLRNPLVAMEDFRDRLAARGIKLLLVPIPGKPSVYPEKLYPAFRGNAVSPTLGLIEDLKRRGFETVDLFTPLMRAKEQGRFQLYLKRDTHWTPQGMEIAAQAVAARIRQLAPGLDTAAGLGSDGPRFALRDTTVPRWGDIAEMTKVPERRSIWDEEPVEAHPVVDLAAEKPYRDDPASPVLWLGDSFSRIYQTDAPGSAGIISHVAYLLNRPLASIVNDGGASTVVRYQLARRPELLQGKKLVVWTFVERDLRFGSKGWALTEIP